MARNSRKLTPWPHRRQKKVGKLITKTLLEAEKKLPGSTGAEKKEWVRNRIDDIVILPPIAEEISDFIIFLAVEIGYQALRNAEKASKKPTSKKKKNKSDAK